jgi:DNA excision repair protein ERCC-4
MPEVSEGRSEEGSSDEPYAPLIASIVVDHRELGSGVPEALQGIPGVEMRVEALPLGDYLVSGVCLFERKTLPDLAESLIDGRLFSQAARLSSSAWRVAVILEGTSQDLAGSGMRREALLGAMVSLTLIFELPVLRSREPEETARLLIYAAQQLRRNAGDSFQRHGRRPKRKRRVQLHLLQGLPGVGPDRAAGLLERFGTVQAVMTAPPEALMEVKGIGETTAGKIRAALE